MSEIGFSSYYRYHKHTGNYGGVYEKLEDLCEHIDIRDKVYLRASAVENAIRNGLHKFCVGNEPVFIYKVDVLETDVALTEALVAEITNNVNNSTLTGLTKVNCGRGLYEIYISNTSIKKEVFVLNNLTKPCISTLEDSIKRVVSDTLGLASLLYAKDYDFKEEHVIIKKTPTGVKYVGLGIDRVARDNAMGVKELKASMGKPRGVWESVKIPYPERVKSYSDIVIRDIQNKELIGRFRDVK